MDDLFDLRGRAAVVTGGTAGIGLAMADALAAHGADVSVWGRDPARNQAAAEQLARHGTRVHVARCDVSDEAAVDAAVRETVDAIGPVHSCFVNAGTPSVGTPFTEMATEEWRHVLAVNLDGAFFTLRAMLGHMVDHGEGGSVVTISSLAATEGQPRGQHYAATKGGIISATKAIAVEFARHRIRANAILPGWIETDMANDFLSSEGAEAKILPRVPQRRWGSPRDFAGVAVYLASDASAYHTGDTITIDGGYSIF